jgi:hypothetical protein
MREEPGRVPFLYRAMVWVDAHRVKVFSGLTVVAGATSWLTGSGFLELVALTSLIMVLVNLFCRPSST